MEERNSELKLVRRKIGQFPSHKMGTSVAYGSKLELDLFYCLEIDKQVLSYKKYPTFIEYFWNGRARIHSPHLLVERPNRQQLFTIKPIKYYQDEETFSRFRAVREVCLKQGYEFSVITEMMVRVEPTLNNIKKLWRYRLVPVSLSEQIAAKQFVRDHESVRLSDLCAHLVSEGVEMLAARQIVYALLFKRLFEINWEEPLNESSVIHWIR